MEWVFFGKMAINYSILWLKIPQKHFNKCSRAALAMKLKSSLHFTEVSRKSYAVQKSYSVTNWIQIAVHKFYMNAMLWSIGMRYCLLWRSYVRCVCNAIEFVENMQLVRAPFVFAIRLLLVAWVIEIIFPVLFVSKVWHSTQHKHKNR